jgi:potassium/hydrogen antiporter
MAGTRSSTPARPGPPRAYQVIFVIVGFSVTVQGGLVSTLAHRLRIPLRTVEPEPALLHRPRASHAPKSNPS